MSATTATTDAGTGTLPPAPLSTTTDTSYAGAHPPHKGLQLLAPEPEPATSTPQFWSAIATRVSPMKEPHREDGASEDSGAQIGNAHTPSKRAGYAARSFRMFVSVRVAVVLESLMC
jgi:hypothetical protein